MSGFEEGVHFTFGFEGGGIAPQPPAHAPPPPAPAHAPGAGPGGAVAWRVHPNPPPDAEFTPVDIAGPLLPPSARPLRRALVSGAAAAAALASERGAAGGGRGAQPTGLATTDLAPGVYEGGFKAWEGGEALARLLAGDGRAGAPLWVNGGDHAATPLTAVARAAVAAPLTGAAVLELGAGAALPSLVAGLRGVAALDVADFNPAVLDRVSAVNVWDAGLGEGVARFWAGDWRGLPGALLAKVGPTPPWGLVLAAEVTYAPASLAPFLACLDACLGQGAVALIATKRYYFGVGGGSGDLLAGIGASCPGLEAGLVASTEGNGGGEVAIDVVGVVRRKRV